VAAFTETERQRISAATSGTIFAWKSLSVASTMTRSWLSKLRKSLSTVRNFAEHADSGTVKCLHAELEDLLLVLLGQVWQFQSELRESMAEKLCPTCNYKVFR
jgi:hypothetical protein